MFDRALKPTLAMSASAVAEGDRSALIFTEYVHKPGESIVLKDKKLVVMAGITIKQLVVKGRQARIEGPCDIDQIIVDDPRESDGTTDADAIHWGNVSGDVGDMLTTETGEDVAKLGRGSHDFTVHKWTGRAKHRVIPPDHIPGTPGAVHQDGWQVMEAHNCYWEWVDYDSPTGNNGGFWFNPISIGEKDPARANDPTLITDCVVRGGIIKNNNFGIHLGPSTRCGAMNTTLVGKHPFGILPNAPVLNPVDVNNKKIRIR